MTISQIQGSNYYQAISGQNETQQQIQNAQKQFLKQVLQGKPTEDALLDTLNSLDKKQQNDEFDEFNELNEIDTNFSNEDASIKRNYLGAGLSGLSKIKPDQIKAGLDVITKVVSTFSGGLNIYNIFNKEEDVNKMEEENNIAG